MSETKTDRLCRTCMNDSNSHSPIYRELCLEDSILFEVINDVCQLEVIEGDGLPEYICRDCLAKLSEFQKFKCRAHEVNVALQRMKEHELSSQSDSLPWESCKTEDESNFEQENDGSDLGSRELCGSTLALHHDWIKPDYSAMEHEKGDVNPAGMDQVKVKVEPEDSFDEVSNGREDTPYEEYIGIEPEDIAYNAVGFDGTTPATTVPLQVTCSSVDGTSEETNEEPGMQREGIWTSLIKDIGSNGKFNDTCEEPNSISVIGRYRRTTAADNRLEGKRSRKSKVYNEAHKVVIQKANLDKKAMMDSSGGVVAQDGSRSDTQVGLENLTRDEQVEHLSRTHSFLEKLKAEPPPRDSGWYICDLCRKGFFDKCSLGNHLRGHMGLDPIRCVIGRGSTSKGVDSLCAEAMGIGNVCSVCGKAFKDDYCLEAHMRRYHLDQGKRSKSLCKHSRFFCDTCGKGYYRKRELIYHIRIHTGEKPFRCHVCSKAFSCKNTLKEHVLSHGSEMPNQCHLCGKRFTYRSGLAIHIKTHLEKKYGCMFCEKMFSQKSGLKRHLTTHSDEKPFLCNVCGKTFKLASGLKAHLGTVHGEAKRHRCDICGKEFLWKSLLDNHIEVHGDERPYACKVCDKTFKTKDSAGKHQRTHSGLKPHSCTFCTKRFLTTGNLKTHLRTHTLEKPFACGNCGRSFSQSASLMRHSKSCCKKEMAT